MSCIPKEFKKYFWDCDFNKLDFIKNKNFILGKLLLFGDLDAIMFVLKNYERIEVSSFIDKKGAVILDKVSFNFWGKIVRHNELWER